MRPSRLTAVATLALLAAASPSFAVPLPRWLEQPVPIAVVKTWTDLLGRQPFDAGGGVRVRLGLESDTCPRWSAVLLYAYTEAFDDQQPMQVNRDRLGPLWVSVTFGGRSLDAQEKTGRIRLHAGSYNRGKRLLFVRAIMVDQAGRYEVTVRDGLGRPLASTRVFGTEYRTRPYHPWSPLLVVQDTQYAEVNVEKRALRVAPAVATNPADGIALPHVVGYAGLSVTDRPQGQLPALVPADADPGMRLTVDSKTATLRLQTAEKGWYTWPRWRFLARWWVNGRPIVPRQLDCVLGKNDCIISHRDDDIRVQLKLNTAKLGVRPGDKVEVQLLHCPSGWLPVRSPQECERDGGPELPRLTNRVSFVIR